MAMTFFGILCLISFALLFLIVLTLAFLTKGRTRKLLTAALVLADLGGLLLLLQGRRWHLDNLPWAGPALKVMSVLFMAQVFLVLLTALAVLVRAAYRKWTKPVPFSPARRRLLKGAALYPIAALAPAVYGEAVERNQTVVREYDIPVRGLPASMEGLRLVQLSDVHLGYFYSLDRYRQLLEKSLALDPDFLMLTGDIYDDERINDEAVSLTAAYADRVRHGLWFCLGNHEHHRNAPHILQKLADTPIHVLVNRAEEVPAFPGLWIAGSDYPMNPDKAIFERDKAAYFTKTMEEVPDDAVTILLAHHPEFIDNAAERHVALTLTGHTHGSQFGFLGMPIPVFKYTRGFVHIGDSYGYVHCGNGSWFPMRIGCPPEIAVFTLRRA